MWAEGRGLDRVQGHDDPGIVSLAGEGGGAAERAGLDVIEVEHGLGIDHGLAQPGDPAAHALPDRNRDVSNGTGVPASDAQRHEALRRLVHREHGDCIHFGQRAQHGCQCTPSALGTGREPQRRTELHGDANLVVAFGGRLQRR